MDYTPRTALGSFFYIVLLLMYWIFIVPFFYIGDKLKHIKAIWDNEKTVLSYRKHSFKTFPRHKITQHEYLDGVLSLTVKEGHTFKYKISEQDYKDFVSVMYGFKDSWEISQRWKKESNN